MFNPLQPKRGISLQGMKVRHGTPKDIAAIIELEKQTPELAHWSEQAYRAAFEPGAPDRIVLVSEMDSALQAFLIARFAAAECELENIVVAPKSRRRGIASELLESLRGKARERGAERVLLEVRESNGAARSLYSKLGFEESGRRKNYYNDPAEDAILYTLTL